MKADIYTIRGLKKEGLKLPDLFTQKVNQPLLAQTIRVYQDRKHPGLSKVKTRGEVSISTRKIYRQKGTGYARHGAKSAPIFVGGGVAHGPTGSKRELTLPKKLKRQSLSSVLSLKAKRGQVVFVDKLNLIKKTKEAGELVGKLLKVNDAKLKKVTLVLSDSTKFVNLFFRNLPNVNITYFNNLNAHDVYFGGLIVLDTNIVSKTKVQKKKVSVNKATKNKSMKKKPVKQTK